LRETGRDVATGQQDFAQHAAIEVEAGGRFPDHGEDVRLPMIAMKNEA